MLKKLGQWFGDKWVCKGDMVSIVWKNPLSGEEELISHEITKEMHITEAKIYEFENEFDLKEGYAGIIGNDDE